MISLLYSQIFYVDVQLQTLKFTEILSGYFRFTDALMYYSLSLNTQSLSGSVYLNTLILGAVEIPANFIAIILLNWKFTGRRLTCSWALILAGVASFLTIFMILKGMCNQTTAWRRSWRNKYI